MKKNLNNLANLLMALMAMRKELQLEVATESELAVLAAIYDLSNHGKTDVHISLLKDHQLVRKLPKPTLYNALKGLAEKGKCTHVGTERSGLYRISG